MILVVDIDENQYKFYQLDLLNPVRVFLILQKWRAGIHTTI